MLKNIIKIAILLPALLILTGNQNMAQAQEYYILPNGMEVLIDQDDRFPLVSMRLYVRAGSAHEQPGQEGISHFLEHMVFKGTQKRGPGQVATEIEEAGGYLNAATSFDYTVYTIDLPAQKWRLGLDVLQDMIFGSVFDPDELAREKNVVLAEIQRSLDNPGSRVFRSIQSMIFHETPYFHPILGYPETVKSFEQQDLKDYVQHMYQPGSMVLAISGRVQADQVLDEARKLFGGLQNSDHLTLPRPIPDIFDRAMAPQDRVRVEHGPWRKAYMAMAVPAPDLNSPKTAAFDVLAYLLGGDSTSMLFRQFKYDLEMVDHISAQVLSLERAGLMYFYVQLGPDRIEPFWEQFLDRLTTLKAEDFSAGQIQRAVTNIEDSLFRARETLGGKAGRLGFSQLFERSPRAQEQYLHNLQRVSHQDLQDLIDNYLCPEQMVVTTLTPEQVPLSRDLLVSSLDQAPCPDQKPEPELLPEEGETRILDLGSGRTLVLIPDHHLPHASVNIAWPGGNSLVSGDQQGLPELSARTLTRQTRDRSFEQIQEFLRDRASSITASASRDSFNVSARFPRDHSSQILDLISEMILSPGFGPGELQRAASDQIADIRQQEDRPLGYAFRHLFPFLFASGSYGYLHLGEEDFLEQVTPEMVQSYWDSQRAQPFVVSVCGSIDQQALDRFVDSLKTIQVRQEELTPDFIWSDQRIKDVDLKDRSQAHILMIFPIPGKEHGHTPGLSVLNRVLAGQGGVLFRELRDKQGLAYSVTSLLWQSPATGFLALYIGTYEDRVDQAVDGFQQVIAGLRDQELGRDEVARAANLIYGEYHRGRQTISSRSSEAASLLVQGLDLEYNLEMTELAAQITPAQIKELAQTYLDSDQSYLMRILPK
ncbi:M16 family metallopeptidase [Desulfonatronovibrio hydrogenovorans]|uniref:M16 family metallopeptidase n=1 Tax=Desulfonatronovibrio hydrogenovorans TaxID=53245 RepID=UPI00068D562F|nr:pitrilysin family protein [Desulfonatronovibrio hydrogenovorans]